MPGAMPRQSLWTPSFAALLLASLVLPAQAQDMGARVEEITVTAQKREQRFIEVPINLTALSGDFLQDLGYYDYSQIGTLVPGLTVQAQSPNNPGYNIRGITTDDGSAQFEPRVSLYENGVPTSRSRGSYAEVFDAERVEVLKGPQSTLFGRSAEIGAISVVTNKPTDQLDSSIRLGGGNLGYFLGDAWVNVPISEYMATRVAVISRQRNGFLQNLAGGNLNGLGVTAVRGSMRFWPTDDLTLDLILGYQHDDVPGTSFKAMNLPTIGSTTSPFTAADLEQGTNLGIKRDLWSALFQAEWSPNDMWSVSSSTSWRQFDSKELFDADGSASPSLFFGEIAKGKQFNQEIRANFAALEQDLNGFFGIDLFWEDGTQNVPLNIDDGTVFALAQPTPQIPNFLYTPEGGFAQNGNNTFFEFTNFGRTFEFDVFADATYRLLEGLDITAGVRGIWLWKKSQYVGSTPVSEPGTECPGFGPLPCSTIIGLASPTTDGTLISATDNFGKAVGRAVLHYNFADRFDIDATVFGGWNRGWRPPVLQVQEPTDEAPTGIQVIPGETVDSYEIGGKGLFFDGRLQLEGSFYYYDYQNFQITFFERSGLAGQFTTVNGGEAVGYGTELALNSQPWEWLNFFSNFAWTHARFDSDVFVPTGEDGQERNLKGSQFRLTPEYKVNIGGQFFYDISSRVSSYFTTWFTWQSQIFFENTNDTAFRQGSYGLWNARIGANILDVGDLLGTGESQLGLAMFAYNILDKQFLIDAGNTGNTFGVPTFVAGPPRLWGGEVTYMF